MASIITHRGANFGLKIPIRPSTWWSRRPVGCPAGVPPAVAPPRAATRREYTSPSREAEPDEITYNDRTAKDSNHHDSRGHPCLRRWPRFPGRTIIPNFWRRCEGVPAHTDTRTGSSVRRKGHQPARIRRRLFRLHREYRRARDQVAERSAGHSRTSDLDPAGARRGTHDVRCSPAINRDQNQRLWKSWVHEPQDDEGIRWQTVG